MPITKITTNHKSFLIAHGAAAFGYLPFLISHGNHQSVRAGRQSINLHESRKSLFNKQFEMNKFGGAYVCMYVWELDSI